MTKGKKITLLALMGATILSSATLATSVGATIAGFAATDRADQTVYSTAGEVKKSIFLDCDTLWNILGNEIFYMKVWVPAGASAWILPSKTVTMTVSNNNAGTRTLYVFEYDSTVYTKLMFARINPNGLTTENINSQIWNKTYDRSYDSDYNYYYINDWVLNTQYSTNSRGEINANGRVTNYASEANSNS